MSLEPDSTQLAQAIDRQLYNRFAKLNLPRHTSYPSVPFWDPTFDSNKYPQKLRETSERSTPTSFYLHVPFCERLCHYCGCNKLIISRQNHDAEAFSRRFLDGIEQELSWINRSTGDKPWNVHQIHWGGGTPTWLGLKEIETVWNLLTKSMSIASNAEISIELDPRVTSFEQLRLLRDLGFNRVSLGVQDFDERVQEAVQRIQPRKMVESFVAECRRVGFNSINFDLIYGLPLQNRDSMSKTLDSVVDLSPDRIAFYRLALLPDVFKWQRTFKESNIPSDDLVLDFMLQAIDVFTSNGWDFIGLDHFAKSTDELAKAYREGTLRRSFQGMTTGDELPVIGVGPSAISCMDGLFAQNETQFPAWTKMVGAHGCATIKGHHLSPDDEIRKWSLNQLYCCRMIDKSIFQQKFSLEFDQYFKRSQAAWLELTSLGLIDNSPSILSLRPLTGWLLLRVVAATIDGYLDQDAWRTGVHSNTASRVG